ncbi:MAG: RCC1 domain-containing protein, partial [Actinomycetota bacterium]|nr:RCC1 domain-containing protein [Actinomycetota bacterium]
QLGYGNTNSTYSQTPAALGPMDLGPGRTATAISAGEKHTCARLDDHGVRCWGYNPSGQLGYCNTSNVGDSQTPGSAGPVNLEPGDGGALCPDLAPASTSRPAPSSQQTAPTKVASSGTGGSDAARARGLRSCLAAVAAQSRRERSLTRRGSARQRAQAKRELAGRAASGRRRCLHRYGRIPGLVNGLRALTRARNRIELDFTAPGTDGEHPPPARSYLVKQSLSPIRDQRDFTRAQALCKGGCSFHVTQVGTTISLTITNLHAHTIYYYAIAARDNVSGQLGPRSHSVMARTQ